MTSSTAMIGGHSTVDPINQADFRLDASREDSQSNPETKPIGQFNIHPNISGDSGPRKNRKFDSSSMVKLMRVDPPRYGWTAIGGVASILTPHEMARRVEAKEDFLKRQIKEGDVKAHTEDTTNFEKQIYKIEIEEADKEREEDLKNISTDAVEGEATKSSESTNPDEKELIETDNSTKGKDPPLKKISIKSISDEGVVDIYTYHRGRVGEELRDEKTGELLCDMEPVDTNHYWRPGKTIAKVTVKFPVADPDDVYVDSDLEEDEVTAVRNDVEGGEERETRTRSTRNALSRNNNTATLSAVATELGDTQKESAVSCFREVIEWDLADPRNPQPLEYASNIAAEFGLNFTQTMELAESIQKQLDEFLWNHNPFHAPILLEDPYGGERPDAHYGPPDSLIMSVAPGSRGGGGSGNGGGSGVGTGTGRKNSTFNRAASSRRHNVSSAPRPPRSRPFKSIVEVVSKDQLPVAGKEGDKYTKEVLKRAKAASQEKAMEFLNKNEEAISVVKNENCHICHIRRNCGIMFHCRKHNFCDNHCAVRLGFRVNEYDPTNPKNIPVDYCPVCCLSCICAKCTRRLDKVSAEMKICCEVQNCEPENVVMDVFEKCSGYKKLGLGTLGTTPTYPPSKKQAPKIERSDTSVSGNVNSKNLKTSRYGTPDVGGGKPSERRASKKRKLDPDIWGRVKKVRPTEFPKELHGSHDMDPSEPDDYIKVFTPEGSFIAESGRNTVNEESYQKVITIKSPRNFNHCFACITDDNAENLVFCSKCPRAFHRRCLNADGCSDDVTNLPHNWECQRCHRDKQVLPTEESLDQLTVLSVIEKAFSNMEKDSYFKFGTILLSNIYQILNQLKKHDHGILFLSPVDPREVKDYLDVVSRPMDYGTISSKLEMGSYVNDIAEGVNAVELDDDYMTAMEKILFHVLRDIEQVYHNCLLYNQKGCNYYRCGEVHLAKWRAFYKKFVEDRTGESVKIHLNDFRKSCKLERQNSNRVRHFQVLGGDHPNRKAVAVYDPDIKMIVKQYSSKTSAITAAMILKNAGYECEVQLTERNVKEKLKIALEDDSKMIFGYRWIFTDDLRSANFKLKEKSLAFGNDSLTSPAADNIVILREDKLSGARFRGFESEQSAFEDWSTTRAAAINSVSGIGDKSDFVNNFLDGNQSIDGVVWRRVQTNSGRYDDVIADQKEKLFSRVCPKTEDSQKKTTYEEMLR
mmetsp:Transcript_26003/g.54463  ORF Transcript_26003/g.54463 Transcript_26003/m.54463 type:complete len:1204 (-) Transcript_26003:93-3704(-)